jgi:hypothetical protein
MNPWRRVLVAAPEPERSAASATRGWLPSSGEALRYISGGAMSAVGRLW